MPSDAPINSDSLRPPTPVSSELSYAELFSQTVNSSCCCKHAKSLAVWAYWNIVELSDKNWLAMANETGTFDVISEFPWVSELRMASSLKMDSNERVRCVSVCIDGSGRCCSCCCGCSCNWGCGSCSNWDCGGDGSTGSTTGAGGVGNVTTGACCSGTGAGNAFFFRLLRLCGRVIAIGFDFLRGIFFGLSWSIRL